MSRVALISTGGTIDSLGASALDHAFYTEHQSRLADGELLAGIPEMADIAEVTEVQFRRVPSYALTAADWAGLATEVDRLLAGEFTGVVVTHGTNTIEETGFALHLTVRSSQPVVLVGAMRPANGLSADGPLNLVDAVRVAAAPESRGVLVVLNQTIHAAPWVTKTTTFRPDALASPDTGPVGYVEADGRVAFHNQPVLLPDRLRFDAGDLVKMPRVDLITSYVGADGVLIDAAVAAGAKGIVMAGTGAGRCTPAENEALDRAVSAGVVVCQANRVAGGRVLRSPRMRSRGLVTADALSPWKARILLGLALTRTSDVDELQAHFAPAAVN
jgi:L-asparaginase